MQTVKVKCNVYVTHYYVSYRYCVSEITWHPYCVCAKFKIYFQIFSLVDISTHSVSSFSLSY